MKHTDTNCPTAKVARLLSDTWTMLIIHHLLEKPMRFCELETALVGISTRTLTNKLLRLQTEKIIKKITAGYTLTKRGSRLGDIIHAMSVYGKRYL